MTVHEMKLRAEPFAAIASGTKTIESRLYDEKRRQIQVGDQILFRRDSDPNTFARTIVLELIRRPTFKELFSVASASEFGAVSTDALLRQIYEYYSKEDEAMYGVLGIRLAIVL